MDQGGEGGDVRRDTLEGREGKKGLNEEGQRDMCTCWEGEKGLNIRSLKIDTVVGMKGVKPLKGLTMFNPLNIRQL